MKVPNASTRLKNLANTGDLPPCLAIVSNDTVRRERAVQYLLKRGQFQRTDVEKNSTPISTFTFGEQQRSTFRSFVERLTEPSLFSDACYGIARKLEKARAADVEGFESLLGRIQSGTSLILIGESLPNIPTFKRILEKHQILIAFEELKGAELKRWVERELNHAEIRGVTDEIVDTLITLCDDSPDLIAHTVEKLALFLDGSPISKDTLQDLLPALPRVSDFDVAAMLAGSSRDASEVFVQQLLDQGSVPFMLLGLISKTWLQLARIRALDERKVAVSEIRSATNIAPWLFNKYLPLARRYSTQQLTEHIAALTRADFALKDRSLGPEAIFSSVITSLHPSTRR